MMNRKDHHIVRKIATKFLAAWDSSSRLSESPRKFEDNPQQTNPVSEILRYADLDYIKTIIKNPDDLISFAGGWVNHKAPEKLRDAYKTISSNIDSFHTSGGYSATLGEKEFKKAICKFEKKLYNMEIHEDEIAVGSGSTQLTMEVLRVLLDPKDKILLLDPTYVNFLPQLTVGFSDIEILHHHYAHTLKHWYNNLLHNKEKIIDMFDERFFRMWEFYLLISQYSFKHMGNVVFQILISKNSNNLSLTRNYMYN